MRGINQQRKGRKIKTNYRTKGSSRIHDGNYAELVMIAL